MRQWYHRLAHLFEPDYHSTVAVDETKISVEDDEVYVWAAVDVDTFEVVHIEVSPGRSNLDALLFLKTVLKRCRGQPVIIVDRGSWYDWVLDDLDLCESRRKTWGKQSLVEAWFDLSKYRTRLFYSRFPHYSFWKPVDRWGKPSPQSTVPSLNLVTIPTDALRFI